MQFYFVQLPNLLMWMVRRLYKKEKKCRFHLTKSIPFAVRFLYVLRKGDKDNEKIMRAYKNRNYFSILIE